MVVDLSGVKEPIWNKKSKIDDILDSIEQESKSFIFLILLPLRDHSTTKLLHLPLLNPNF
jgi:hypothetical protein